VKVRDIKKGDVFYDGDTPIWEALEDAGLFDKKEIGDYGDQEAHCRVQFCADKGQGIRVWDDPEIELTIQKAETKHG